MKRLLLTLLALALPALAFEYWGADFSTFTVGENLLDRGYSVFSTYEGAPVIVEFDGQNCLQLQAKDESESDYNMILTPVIGPDWETLSDSGLLPTSFDVIIRGTVLPGSDVDLLALYGQSTNRFFYFNFNASGKLTTSPGSKDFSVNTDTLNVVSARLHFADGKYSLVSVTVNEDSWSGEVGCEASDAPRFLRLSTHLSALAEGGKGAIFGSVGVDFTTADARISLEDTFDEYEDGTEVGEQPGYGFYSTYNGYTTVVSGLTNFTSKCITLKQSPTGSEDYVMLLTPAFEMYPEDPATQLTTFSFSFVASSATELIALYDKSMNRFFYLRINANTGVMDSNPGGVLFSNIYTDCETPNEISFIFDPMAEKFTSVTCNDETQEISIMPSGTYDMPARLRLSTQLTSTKTEAANGTVYDYYSVKIRNRSNDPMLYCADEALISYKDDSASFTIYNAGPPSGTIEFSISSDKDWLEFSPASGSFNVSETLTLSAKEGTEEGFYRAKMTIDGGAAGTKVVSVICQNGNIIYEQDFDEYEEGSIVGQDGWEVESGSVVIREAYGSSGKCAYTTSCGGGNGCSKYLPKPWPENEIIQAELEFYWPSDSKCPNGFILMRDSGTAEKFEGCLVADTDGIRLSYIQGETGNITIKDFPLAPYDVWVKMEYTLDLQTQKLLSFGWDGAVTNFTDFALKNPACNYYSSFGFAFYHSGNESFIAVDNLKISIVPRESDPQPILPPYLFIGTNSLASVTLANAGGGSIDFTVSVEGGAGVVESTIESGTLKDVVNINLNVDREALEDGYYRGYLLVDCGSYGVLTSLYAFSSGDVYYQTNFDPPYYKLGDFNGQDGWVSDNAGNVANIIEDDEGGQILDVNFAGGWGGYMHTTQVPKDSLMKVSFDFLLPQEMFDPSKEVLFFLKQHNRYTPLLQMTVNMETVDGVDYFYGICDDGSTEMPRIESLGEYINVTYVFDLKEGLVQEFTIGDEPFYPSEVYLNKSNTSCDNIFLCVTKGMNVKIKNFEVSVIPEPAFFVVALLCALGLKRR